MELGSASQTRIRGVKFILSSAKGRCLNRIFRDIYQAKLLDRKASNTELESQSCSDSVAFASAGKQANFSTLSAGKKRCQKITPDLILTDPRVAIQTEWRAEVAWSPVGSRWLGLALLAIEGSPFYRVEQACPLLLTQCQFVTRHPLPAW